MTYKTILTTKGTTTIPSAIRKQLGLKPGMYVSFVENKQTGEYTVKRAQTIEDIRAINKAALARAQTGGKAYTSGQGFGAQ